MDNNLLGNEQYGFRSIHSTALALSRASNNWLINIDNGSLNSVVFLDIQKAFDTVDHEIMLNKLRCYSVQEDELKFFLSYLDGQQQCTSVNGIMSSPREITCGIQWGSILGPLLFIIYMNDLPLSVKEVNITMYADDTSLSKAIRGIQELKMHLTPAFVQVCKWFQYNKLSLNAVTVIRLFEDASLIEDAPNLQP